MPNYFKQFLLVSYLFTSAYAMKKDIIYTDDTRSSTLKLLSLLHNNKQLQEKD